jgi:hypothetical protein
VNEMLTGVLCEWVIVVYRWAMRHWVLTCASEFGSFAIWAPNSARFLHTYQSIPGSLSLTM